VIALIQFGLPALLVSGAAWLFLRLARSAPPRLKFWIAMLGLAAWVVPWPLVSSLPAASPRSSVIRWLDEGVRSVAAPVRFAAPLLSSPAAASPPRLAWLCLLAPGLLWFAIECAAHRRTVRAWRRGSRDGRHLLPLLPPGTVQHAVRIRLMPDSLEAAATGVWRPTIWIGDRLRDEALRTALIHEACHLRGRDPLWLVVVRVIGRAYCWNPIVTLLARHAHLWLEAACDCRCARLLGPSNYRRTLARLLLSAQPRPHGAAALLGGQKQNVLRLELLRRNWRLGWREYAGLVLCAAAAVCSARVAAPRNDPRLGNWAEVGESAPDGEPILQSFEALGGGFVRFKSDVMADGSAALSSDYRCDGGSYAVLGRLGRDPGEWRLSCRMLGPLTVEVTFAAADDSLRQQRTIDTVSFDGETYTSTLTSRAADGASGPPRTREFWRLH
jgi:hypothetical protein